MLHSDMSVEALLREAERVENTSQQLPGPEAGETKDPNEMDLA